MFPFVWHNCMACTTQELVTHQFPWNLRRRIRCSDWVHHVQVIVGGIAAGIWAYQKHRQRTNVHIMALNLVRGVPLTPREKETMLDILTPPPPPRKWWWPGKWCGIHVLDLVAAHKWPGCTFWPTVWMHIDMWCFDPEFKFNQTLLCTPWN